MVEIAEVRWRYAGTDTATLDGLNLRIEQGETVVLCGASGSGKSTVLRLVNGLIPHFHRGNLEGVVRLGGDSVAEQPPDSIGRRTGTVLQHPRRQFFTDTVGAETAFALENFGEPPALIRERVGSTLAEHHLGGLAARRLTELSGGQQQQVACAAATAHRPSLLLLDEPTANLSEDAIAGFLAWLAELRASGVTVVIAEHRLDRLAALADRIVLLRDGRVATEWRGAEFVRLPQQVRSAHGLRGGIAPHALPRAHGYGPGIEQAPEGSVTESGAAEGLTLHEIRCVRKGRPVLDIAAAHFPAGAVTAVTGPNGAGKTTLARVLTGLQRHSGRVTLNGRSVNRRHRLGVSALVMQDVQRQLFTESVAAELRLGAGGSGRSRSNVERVHLSLLRDLGLVGLDDRHPLALSGGQQQRLLVAVARLSGRRVVVFDEPSSGVDARHLASISGIMRDLTKMGAVVVLISHDNELLTRAADLELRLRPLPAADARSTPLMGSAQ